MENCSPIDIAQDCRPFCLLINLRPVELTEQSKLSNKSIKCLNNNV